MIECLPYNKVFGMTFNGPHNGRLHGFYIFEKDSFYGLFIIQNNFLDTFEVEDIVYRFESNFEFQAYSQSNMFLNIFWYPKEAMIRFLHKYVLNMYNSENKPTQQFIDDYIDFIYEFEEYINPHKKEIRNMVNDMFNERWETLCHENNIKTKEDLCNYVIKEQCALLQIKPEEGENYIKQSTSFGLALEYMGLIKYEENKLYLSSRSGGGFRNYLEKLPSDVGCYLS